MTPHRTKYGYIAYADCPHCKGQGYKYNIYSIIRCDHCKQRAISEGIYTRSMLRELITSVIDSVRREVNAARREGTKVTSPEYIQEYNVTNPLAKEYRRLLCLWWSYQEPECLAPAD